MLDGLTPRGLFPAASYIYCNCQGLSYRIVSSAVHTAIFGTRSSSVQFLHAPIFRGCLPLRDNWGSVSQNRMTILQPALGLCASSEPPFHGSISGDQWAREAGSPLIPSDSLSCTRTSGFVISLESPEISATDTFGIETCQRHAK